MNRSLRFAILLALICLLFARQLPSPTRAQTPENVSLAVEAGLDGYCMQNHWYPVRITAENNGPPLEGDLFVKSENGSEEWRFQTPISLPTVSRKAWTLYIFPPRLSSSIQVGIHSDGEDLLVQSHTVTCFPENEKLLGVWAASPSAFNAQTGISAPSGRPNLVLLSASTFPEHPQALSMLTAITLSDVDTGQLSKAQINALTVWVENGGQLLIAGGPGAEQTTRGLAQLLPLTPEHTVTVEDLHGLQNLLTDAAYPQGETVIATGTVHNEAEIWVEQDNHPLIVARNIGFGRVIFLAADPALEPLRTWVGSENLYQALIGKPVDRPSWSAGFQDWFAADQALNAVPGLGIPSIWLICGFIFFYIALVGPVNYLALRVLKKRDLTWITVPAIVVLCTATIFFTGSIVAGNRPVLNRLSVVQVWEDQPRAEVDALIGLFSPERATFSLSMDEGFIAHPLPRQGFSAAVRPQVIEQSPTGFHIPDVRVDTGGLEGFVVAGQVAAPQLTADLNLHLASTSPGRLDGVIRNLSSLTLHDAVLLTPSGGVRIGDLLPGDTTTVALTMTDGPALPQTSQPIPGQQFGSDDTLIEVFGTNYMYPSSNSDIEELRRFYLLSSAIDGGNGKRGTRFYLLGWTTDAPFQTSLDGVSPRTADTTLYIFHLDPNLEIASAADGTFTLTPDLFTWSVFGNSTGSNEPSAYDATISSGQYALSFTPGIQIPFSEVVNLELHLEGSGIPRASELDLFLWDFSEGTWSPLTVFDWGDTAVPDPGRFVSPGGEIRVQIAYSGEEWVEISRLDFTLVIAP